MGPYAAVQYCWTAVSVGFSVSRDIKDRQYCLFVATPDLLLFTEVKVEYDLKTLNKACIQKAQCYTSRLFPVLEIMTFWGCIVFNFALVLV